MNNWNRWIQFLTSFFSALNKLQFRLRIRFELWWQTLFNQAIYKNATIDQSCREYQYDVVKQALPDENWQDTGYLHYIFQYLEGNPIAKSLGYMGCFNRQKHPVNEFDPTQVWVFRFDVNPTKALALMDTVVLDLQRCLEFQRLSMDSSSGVPSLVTCSEWFASNDIFMDKAVSNYDLDTFETRDLAILGVDGFPTVMEGNLKVLDFLWQYEARLDWQDDMTESQDDMTESEDDPV